ncbi:MAG TPA: hypothetical protein VFS21_15500 [Roseiflexaceae bacterium]|nr:hypothetical protein [Roseiflexaceae bacterium]
MPVTDRMLIGAIAGNPASFESAGEYRFCRTCELIYFTSGRQPDPSHDDHQWFVLPALNPDGSGKLARAFQRYITRWSPERQAELEQFARKKGWDMAMELKYGGGALEDTEAAEWQEIINGRLEQLMRQARQEIEQPGSTLQQEAEPADGLDDDVAPPGQADAATPAPAEEPAPKQRGRRVRSQ